MLAQNKLNITLLILLCALIAGILLLNWQQKPAQISQLSANEIATIKIETSDRTPIIFDKQNEQWIIKDLSEQSFVTAEKITKLFTLMNTSSIKQFTTKSSDLHKYELDNPRVSVYYNDFKVSFGGLDPINNLRYVLVGNTIHLIKDDYYRLLLANKTDFIE